MNFTNKPFEELDIMDDFLINAVATDPDVGVPFCKAVLSVLLQRKIENLRVVAQKTLPALAPGLRGIRMDVEVEERRNDADDTAFNVYDFEPHLKRDMHFPRHNRFYQAKIDSRLMRSGEKDFSKMPNLYVLTITNFDPFGYDYMMYHLRNRCDEVPELVYDDGLQFIYFYTGGSKGGSKEIQEMLHYFQESTKENVTNDAIREIHNYVNQVKILPEVKVEYMKFEEIMAYAREEGLRAGIEEGREAGREAGRREGQAQGECKGRLQAVYELLEGKGSLSEQLKERMEVENNIQKLKEWLLLAAKVESVEEFYEKM